MTTELPAFVIALCAFASTAASADTDACRQPSALEALDGASDVVHVRVVAQQERAGGTMYEFHVIATPRGETKPGAQLTGNAGGPCARHLVVGSQNVLPVRDGRVDASAYEPLPTSLPLQIAFARASDAKARARVVFDAATSPSTSAQDRRSLLAFLVDRFELVRSMSKADRRRVDAALTDAKRADPIRAAMWDAMLAPRGRLHPRPRSARPGT